MICQNLKLFKDHDKQYSSLKYSMKKIKNDLKERVTWVAQIQNILQRENSAK